MAGHVSKSLMAQPVQQCGFIACLHVLSLGCATAAPAGSQRPPIEVRKAAEHVAEIVRAVDLEGAGWPNFRADILPVTLVWRDWSLLFSSLPTDGFVPIEGRRCPCWIPAGLDLDWSANSDELLLRRGMGELEVAPATLPVPAGWLGTLLIPVGLSANTPVPATFVAHEVFHLYQQGQGWFSRMKFHGRNLEPPTKEDAELLVDEQRFLARALRAAPGERPRAIATWWKTRRLCEAEGVEGAPAQELEILEGTARYFDLLV
ncbi:MAG TPA: hypothetical protein VMB50_02590, partial [Myxococcales bacterium]|nr:hypothetical protein [Myxococcales bacterium]